MISAADQTAPESYPFMGCFFKKALNELGDSAERGWKF